MIKCKFKRDEDKKEIQLKYIESIVFLRKNEIKKLPIGSFILPEKENELGYYLLYISTKGEKCQEVCAVENSISSDGISLSFGYRFSIHTDRQGERDLINSNNTDLLFFNPEGLIENNFSDEIIIYKKGKVSKRIIKETVNLETETEEKRKEKTKKTFKIN